MLTQYDVYLKDCVQYIIGRWESISSYTALPPPMLGAFPSLSPAITINLGASLNCSHAMQSPAYGYLLFSRLYNIHFLFSVSRND